MNEGIFLEWSQCREFPVTIFKKKSWVVKLVIEIHEGVEIHVVLVKIRIAYKY